MKKCANCDEDISLLSLANVTIKYNEGVEFCSICCEEEFLDNLD